VIDWRFLGASPADLTACGIPEKDMIFDFVVAGL